jgi:hypothetical protein
MKRMASAIVLVAWAAGLAGCVETVAPPVPGLPPGGGTVVPPIAADPAPAPDSCGAARARLLVGQPASALLLIGARGPIRVLGPDQPMTMDFNPDRLNVFTDAAGRIERVTCG